MSASTPNTGGPLNTLPRAHLALHGENWSTVAAATVESAIRASLGTPSLTMLSPLGDHAAFASSDEEEALRTAETVHAALHARPVWIGVGWTDPRDRVRHGRRVADDVLALALGLRLAPGVYRLRDVIIEHTCAQAPEVSEAMIGLVRPVVEDPALLETMEALVDARGNRSRAAKALYIHRSTIDYRLSRVRALTGYDPAEPQGLQFLRTALALRSLRSEQCGRALSG